MHFSLHLDDGFGLRQLICILLTGRNNHGLFKFILLCFRCLLVRETKLMMANGDHVTMLQRSPTYVVSRPSRDRIANFLHAQGIAKGDRVLFHAAAGRRSRTRTRRSPSSTGASGWLAL